MDAMSDVDTDMKERVVSKYFAHVYLKDALPPGVRVDTKKHHAIGAGYGSLLKNGVGIRKLSKARVVSPLALRAYSHKAGPVYLE